MFVYLAIRHFLYSKIEYLVPQAGAFSLMAILPDMSFQQEPHYDVYIIKCTISLIFGLILFFITRYFKQKDKNQKP